MRLHNIYGYGQLFGFSAFDGENYFENDFIGTLTREKIGIRFEFSTWMKVYFPIETENIKFNAVLSDYIDADAGGKKFIAVFADSDTVVGVSPVLPEISWESEYTLEEKGNTKVYSCDGNRVAVCTGEEKEGIKFAICHLRNGEQNTYDIEKRLDENLDELIKKKLAYYESKPKCKLPEYERMYCKTLSVQKVNTHTPEGNIKYFWTTPDRVPHKKMWLWDSVFHALAISEYDMPNAENAILAVLTQSEADGFIPHAMTPIKKSKITQPPVLAYGVWNLYKKSGNKEFLSECVPYLEKYLVWDKNNRSDKKSGLLKWLVEPDDIKCRCGESGLDNSPRFDFDDELDAVDFSAFFANDARFLSYIYRELENEEKATEWEKLFEELKKNINGLLWDEENGIYCDKLEGGGITHVLSCAGFIPIFAGIPSREQVGRMVKLLLDKTKFASPMPIPSISRDNPSYSHDMWRGGVWMNINYLVIVGLAEYGFIKEADEIRRKVLKNVYEWYEKEGTIFEFYDPENKISPLKCNRKGEQPEAPDFRVHMHSIVDFNWSSCLIMKLIQMEDKFTKNKNTEGI